ncbi:MAG: VWA-like domain-containing protein [Gammaproteobacteria bacterium]
MTHSSGDHRGTAAIQTLIERAPATGSLALWMRHQDVSKLPTRAPIATDGASVFYTPAFEQLTHVAQVGWVAHQILHVAFRHVGRREALRGLIGRLDDELYNVCADALVNSTLSHLSWLSLPARAVRLEMLVQRALGEELTAESALLRFDVETLYRALDDRRGSGQSGDGRGQGGRDESATEAGESQETQASGQDIQVDGPRAAVTRALGDSEQTDLLPGPDGAAPQAIAHAVREWSERLVRGHAADAEFSLLRTLGADVPRVRVPWQQVLRQRLARALVPQPERSWSRPARSWLANQGRTASGRRLPFEPGTVSARHVPRLAVVLDVSGSVDDQMLAGFTAQLRAITSQTRAVAVVVVGDDVVRDVRTFRPGTLTLDEWSLQGGGGTDFAPLLAEAVTHRPDYIVVLTDLDGPAGVAPRCPVLWAVAREHAHRSVPFGRRLVVE